METEIWKSIKDFEGIYEVSSSGRVRSMHRFVKHEDRLQEIKEKILKLNTNSRGYFIVGLCRDGIRLPMSVHQLVANAFLPAPILGAITVIDHINGIRTDNDRGNLRIVTNRFNCSFGERKNRYTTSSRYVGVGWHKASKKWRAYILINNKQKGLGTFINEIDASNAYMDALRNIT